MKRGGRRAVRWGLMAPVMAGVLGTAWWSAKGETLRPVAVFTGLDDGSAELERRMGLAGRRPRAFLFTRYFWLSPDEVLFWQESHRAPAGNGMVRRDVRTKRATPFKPPRGVPPRSEPISLSPDGKWLLYVHASGGKAGTRLYTTALDGSWPAQTWSLGGIGMNGDIGMTEDLIAAAPSSGRCYLTRSLTQPNRPELAVFTVGSRQPITSSFSAAAGTPPRAGSWLSLLGVTSQNRLLVADLEATAQTGGNGAGGGVLKRAFLFDPPPKALKVAAYDLEPASGRPTTGRLPRRFSLPVPAPAEQMQCVLSPGGDRLAWIVVGPPRLTPLVQRLFAFFHIPVGTRASIWVSDLDGSRPPRLINRIGLGDKQPVPVQLAWTPDGKRLSYLHKGAFWSLLAKD